MLSYLMLDYDIRLYDHYKLVLDKWNSPNCHIVRQNYTLYQLKYAEPCFISNKRQKERNSNQVLTWQRRTEVGNSPKGAKTGKPGMMT